MKKREGTTRWTYTEWSQVGVAALPSVLAGMKPGLALYEAQRVVFPKTRWHTRQIIQSACNRDGSKARTCLEAARDMSAEERDRILASSPIQAKRIAAGERDAPPPPDPQAMVPGGRSWSALEWALIYRRVEHLKSLDPTRALSRLVLDAQDAELPEARRRSRSGIYTGVSDGRMEKDLAKGAAHQWLIHEPFDPSRKAWAPPAPPTPPAAAAQEAPQEAQEAPVAPAPMAAQPGPLLAASVAFGAAIARELDLVLRAQRAEIVAELLPRISGLGADMARLIEVSLHTSVQRIVSHELGGVSEPPAVRPKIDVFALPHVNANEVRAVINGAADLRFINPHDRATSKYVPPEGGRIIFATAQVPKATRNSIEAAGIQPLQVAPSPPQLIAAIRDLLGVTAH